MGSQNENIALNWVKEKFDQFGADSTFILKFYKIKSKKSSVNTNSGTAVGVFKGETDSTIVIGGHFDSASREIPGANDNASGTASVIELARIWSQRPRHYTMVFAAFGGEEKGLVGSKYFVEQYGDINKVALMLCLDMTGSDDNILTIAETDSMQAPSWLMRDAFAIDKALGINRLQYPTHFATLNNIGRGGAGSDHIPFLHKKIPAIDFTAGISNSPIHTPQDKIDFISNEMLGKCGSLADSLLKKYQKFGIPTSTNEPFMLWSAFGIPVFIPSWFVVVFVVAAIALAVLAFFISRKNRLRIEKSNRVRFSGLKLLAMMIIIAVCSQFGEAFLQLFKGLRYPWVVHLYKYLWYAAIWAVAGCWIVFQFTRKWRFSPDPYVYSKRAIIILLFFVIVFSAFVSFRLALYPAITLFLFSLIILIPNKLIKSFLSIIAPLPMFRLMFNEVFIFPARFSINSGFNIDSLGASFLYSALFTVIMFVWYLASIYLYSYVITSVGQLKTGLKFFRKPIFGILIILIIVGYGGYLYSLPAYNEMWRPTIRILADYNIQKSEGNLQIVGNEYFKDVEIKADSLHEHYSGRFQKKELPLPFEADWINVAGNQIGTDGEGDTVNVEINYQFNSSHQWKRVFFQLRVDTLEIYNVKTDLNFYHSKNRFTFSWLEDPPESINVNASFNMQRGAKLIRKVTALYPEIPVHIKVTSELANIRYQTEVVFQDTLDLAVAQ